MAGHALGVAPLIHFLHEYVSTNNHRRKEVAGKIEEIRSYWEMLQQLGPFYGYFPKPSKSYLGVKEHYLGHVIEIFRKSEVKITTEGESN